jgi:hypothetical protein
VPAKPAPTFLVIEPAQLVALGWSEHSAGKIALAVHKAQEAYARLEGHGTYIPAPRLTGLAASRPTPPSGRGDSGQAERRCRRCQPAVGRRRQRPGPHSGRARECHLDLR